MICDTLLNAKFGLAPTSLHARYNQSLNSDEDHVPVGSLPSSSPVSSLMRNCFHLFISIEFDGFTS